MAQTVVYGTNFNPMQVYVPGVYLQVIPPQSYFGGPPASVGFVVGTASWGPLNSPIAISNPVAMAAAYGTIQPAALTDTHDLCTDLTQGLAQGGVVSGLMIYGVRVSDGTDTAGSLVLYDLSSGAEAGLVLSLRYTGSLGNGFRAFVNANSSNATTTVTIVPFAGGGPVEIYTNLPTTNAFFAALKSAINNGQGPARPPSAYVIASNNAASITFTGTETTGDFVNVKFTNSTFGGGGFHNVAYTVVSGDTTSTLLATHVTTAINTDATLIAAGIVATSTGAVITITYPAALGSCPVSCAVNGTSTVTATGTLTNGDVLNILVHDAGLAGGVHTVPYTVISGDSSLTLLATHITSAINADSTLSAYGVTATSTGAVISIVSTSTFVTTYTTSKNVGASETLTVAAGPTEVATVENAPTPALGPAVGTFAFAGGTDGRNVTSSNLIGSNTTLSGIYTAQNVQFTPSVIWIAGLTDSTVWATFQSFCDANNIFGLLTWASGTSTSTAVSGKASAGIADYQIGFIKDWVWFFDQPNNVARLISPLATAGGAIATMPPWVSPSNKTVSNIIGTERNNIYTGNVPYSYAELASLGQAGIMVITNPIPRGLVFGFVNGYNSVGNNLANAFVEYSRLTNYIVAANAAILGQFVGELQSQQANDSLRARVKTAVNSFLGQLEANGYIDAFNVQCDLNNNSPISIASHELVIFETITYLASVVTIFTQIQGGTTVNAVSNQLGQQVQ
jgi:hypothetical protein